MPVRQLRPRKPTPSARALKDRLLAEWRNADSTAAQPVILEERGGSNQPIHIYVVWDDWASLSDVERSEVIVEAFEDRYGKDEALNMTVAMGLTTAEADRLAIPYQ
jgi:hypothetical protein